MVGPKSAGFGVNPGSEEGFKSELVQFIIAHLSHLFQSRSGGSLTSFSCINNNADKICSARSRGCPPRARTFNTQIITLVYIYSPHTFIMSVFPEHV